MLLNQISLAIFFLYFVLMSGASAEVMNCSLQRYIYSNNWIKHLMIFLSIYIFTFILNWYTIESLVVENFIGNNNNLNLNNIITNFNNKPYLEKSFYYTIIIYIVFILSTKNEGLFIALFLFGSIALVIGTILTKSINSEIYDNLLLNNFNITSTFFIPTNEINILKSKYNNKQNNQSKQNKQINNDIDLIALSHNSMSVVSIILLLLLLIGSYRYYLKQYRDHKQHWSWYTFWMGTNRCVLLREKKSK